MKRVFALLFLAACVLAANRNLFEGELAVGQEKTATGAEEVFKPYPLDNPERLQGVWNEGKAVFSDWSTLDSIFVHEHYVRGYRPEQPIKFSHQQHVEKNKMECQYCHSGVAKTAYPTIPSVESCMGCHKNVKTDSPEIQKLAKLYEEGKPVEWVPVHNLPEHAHFPHERHVKAGIGCQNCHGQLQRMQAAERVSSLKMGWCLTCHREKGASIDCVTCHY